MLLEQLCKGGHWYVEGIIPIMVLKLLYLCLGRQSFRLLKASNERRRIRVQGVSEWREAVLLIVVQEPPLLE